MAWKIESFNIPDLQTYINGIRIDIDTVKNGIRLKYNNGLIFGKNWSLIQFMLYFFGYRIT